MNVFDRREARPRRWRTPRVRERRVRWFNLPYWVGATLAVDHRDYAGSEPTVAPAERLAAPAIERPVFVVGSPRSGTSFLGSCFAAMPSFSYHREPVILKAAASGLADRTTDDVAADRLLRATAVGLVWMHGDHGKRYVDKNPFTSFFIPRVAATFRDATFVHIVRDGRDVAVSLAEHPWTKQVMAWSRRRDSSGRPYGPFPYFFTAPDRRDEFMATSDLHRAIWVWRDHVEQVRADLAALPAERWIEFRYEDMVAGPERVMNDLADRLAVDDGDRSSLVAAARHSTGAAIGRWRQELRSHEVDLAEWEAGTTLRTYGYVSER